MKRRLFTLIFAFIMIFTTNVFAYRWVAYNNDWYVLDESNDQYLKSILLDVGNNVYYLDDEGKMVTGWCHNSSTDKYYFFDNNQNRNYGGMVFGFNMIDGYYRYFNADGSLATSKKQGEYEKVYLEFYADYQGNLYYNNVLMRDTSNTKSEYYSNPIYYSDDALNNYYLAKYDTIQEIRLQVSDNTISYDSKKGKTKDASGDGLITGGTNYYVDESGTVHTYGDIYETKPFEKFGPMQQAN